ncbi:cytochrome C biogenesis protein CcdA [Rhodobacterales bacterium HKCCE2091]|nr:cytochrome C biogenesis protein CcdA [Rhodobacterales bacterium HKCCE2091]
MKRALAVLLALWLALPAFAVQPDEVLDDPELETRAREISRGLRCPVCQNETIDESNADLARDLRLLVRERLLAGDSDDEVVAYVVDRYGEFVLLMPRASGANWVPILAPVVLVLVGGGVAAAFVRRQSRQPAAPDPGLTEEERARIAELTRGDGDANPGRD